MTVPLRINLGSGQRPFTAPFVNVDINPRWNPDVVADGSDLSIFGSNTADLIVLHHVLEHFGLGEADTMLTECYRVLQPGGSLIVTVPNVDALVRAWIRGRITDYIFFVQVHGAYMGHEADRHKWSYTPKTLRETLSKAAPWRQVRPFDWRNISGASIARDWYICGAEVFK